ncbi:MAG: hypothetical protein CM1200mP2_13140 [Planctomycetaceae bacterium]|nr:MAG: hypothetical protein CM1200mP2_13140 [Planctomycetaceae bacterium]
MTDRSRCYRTILLSLSAAALLTIASRLPAQNAKPFPGTKSLTLTKPLDVVMVAGIDRFALRALAGSSAERPARWKQDFSDHQAYAKSVAANRSRFRTIIGAVDPRPVPPRSS